MRIHIVSSTHLACADLGLPLGAHVIFEGLLVAALSLAITGLNSELC